jgi:tRNA pseudouridine55 synthase
MDGVLNINKPTGPTSHDVVAITRRATGIKRIGHTGTLDPLASGVLVVCIGNATRVIEYMSDWQKSYRAVAVLGAETDSEDITGEVISESDCSHVTREDLDAVLPRFIGHILQVPPMVSAVKHKGRRLYELARKGEVVERAPRPVEIYSLRVIDFQPGEKASFTMDVTCSGGTYIRTLCADIGKALGCGAYMSSLVRTGVGPFRVEDAVTLEQVDRCASEGRLQEILRPMDEVLVDMLIVAVSHQDEALVTNGVILPEGRFESRGSMPSVAEHVRIHSQDGRLIAIGVLRSGPCGELELKPEKVFAGAEG